jgi:hypothetical protein
MKKDSAFYSPVENLAQPMDLPVANREHKTHEAIGFGKRILI